MKTVKTLLMTFCLALAGCGMTDPWEQYEHQGDFTDRLLPSDTEKALCAADGWKMTYQNTDFYFQFSEDGNVVCNSSLFENESTVTYHLDWDDPMEVKVVIAGGGHLSYLSNNEFGETLIVTSVSDNELKCRPESSETEYTMTAVTESELLSAMDNKWAVKNTLTASAGWKFTYEGSDFYFQFSKDGNVTCNSNMPKAATSTTYSFSGSSEDMILTIVGGGHLSYLSEDVYEDSFKVKSHNASQIDNYLEQRVVILQNAAKLLDKAIDLDKDVMTKVAMYRGGNTSSDATRNETSQAVDRLFGQINVAFEQYPNLKAHDEIEECLRQNSLLLKEITAARELYNDSVLQWNAAIQEWPTKMIVAAKNGYTTRVPFTASKEIKEAARGTFF